VIVISNTSPITNLAAVGQLAILHQLYETVLIPDAVYAELTASDSAQPGGTDVQTLPWITTKTVTNQALESVRKL
jgi:predicted nucleic acid-binding protein